MKLRFSYLICCSILLFAIEFCFASGIDLPKEIEKYNVVWDTPSEGQQGSMPLGNGDIGLNVWAEKNGDLLFYVSKTDAWSENSRLLKLGRVRISFSSSPFKEGQPFYQKLDIYKGEILINSGKGSNELNLKIWVDANNPVVYVESESKKDIDIKVSLEIWRDKKKILPGRLQVGDMFRHLRKKGWEERYNGPPPYPTFSSSPTKSQIMMITELYGIIIIKNLTMILMK